MNCQELGFCEPERWCAADPPQRQPVPPSTYPLPVPGNFTQQAFAPPPQPLAPPAQFAPAHQQYQQPQFQGPAPVAQYTIQQPTLIEPGPALPTSSLGYGAPVPVVEEKKQLEPKQIIPPKKGNFTPTPMAAPVPELPVEPVPPPPTINLSREFQKAVVFDIGVFLLWALIPIAVMLAGSGFEPPQCKIIEGSQYDYGIREVREYIDLLELQKQFPDMTLPNPPEAPLACDACGEGPYILPLGGEFEQTWPKPIRAILYFMGLLYCFYGVAMVCDQFTEAIEAITAQQKVKWVTSSAGIAHKVHVKVWNDTIANLTLMALGSSAPEILLNVIEIVGSSFFAGSLGPSTIVGSAAFNLLVIIAVCVSAIPNGETRKIAGTTVYTITAVCSVWAYVWLLIILQVSTPDRVDVWEALVTFGQFPVLAVLAFLGDKGYFDKLFQRPAGQETSSALSDEEAEKVRKSLTAKYGKSISFDVAKQIMEMDPSAVQQKTARSAYRKNVMKGITGASKEAAKEVLNDVNSVLIGFKEAKMIVLECHGILRVPIVASKPPGSLVKFRVYTIDGEAKGGLRYEHRETVLTFGPQDTEKTVEIPIIDNNVWEPEASFYVELADLMSDGCPYPVKFDTQKQKLEIVILNDDEPGTLSWQMEEVYITSQPESLVLKVLRSNGTCGDITVNYETVSGSAIADKDFVSASGTLTFADGEESKTITVGLCKSTSWEVEESFTVVLRDASAGVKFDKNQDGGSTSSICTVRIGSQKQNFLVTACVKMCNPHMISSSCAEWREAVSSIIYVGGSPEAQAECGTSDWIFHALSLLWKVFFSIVPPASLWGGWACFGVALSCIGGTTAIISDVAGLLGCSIGIKDEITAVTLVALGTSLPDTFASKNAAQAEDTADNSVGNVTGSNCVNVFLGLGLPWTMGAVYWSSNGVTADWLRKRYNGVKIADSFALTYPDGGFIVPAGALGFSVTVFALCATTCFAVLIFRRIKYGGELGGPSMAQKRDSGILVLLWFIYIACSILKTLEVI